MKILKIIFAVVIFGLILAFLFFFDANPVLWGIFVLLFYVFVKATSLFDKKKHPKSAGVRWIISDPMPITFWEKLKDKLKRYVP